MTITFRHHAEQQNARRPTWPAALGRLRSRATRWIVAMAKQVFPAIAVLALFAAALPATIALRLAIWLPLYYRH
jgi:hypothetical protein